MNKKIVSYFLIVISMFLFTITLTRVDNQIKVSYEVASNKLNEARITKSDEDIEEANDLIDSVIDDSKKQELKNDLENLKEEIEKEKIYNDYEIKIREIEDNLKEDLLNKLLIDINKIENKDLKETLLNRIDEAKETINKKKKEIEEKRKKEEEIRKQNAYNTLVNADRRVPNTTVPSNVKVIETLKGNITAFTPYCKGCSGYVASGKFVGNGNIRYKDKTYGEVYIVAGDPSYPFGTIVRLKNVDYYGGRDIYAIVLDRGGAIGKNKRALFDLLFALEKNANNFGVRRNVTCEILRIGY